MNSAVGTSQISSNDEVIFHGEISLDMTGDFLPEKSDLLVRFCFLVARTNSITERKTKTKNSNETKTSSRQLDLRLRFLAQQSMMRTSDCT